MTEQHDAFVELVRVMRDLGAVRVRDGSLEVAFAGPPDPPTPPEPARDDLALPNLTEAQREHYRTLYQMAEEVP